MKTTLTITSKGQTTIPVNFRRKLGIDNKGGTLDIELNESNNKAVLTKPITIEQLSNSVSKNIKPGSKAIKNIDEYYQKNRNWAK